MLAWPRPLVGPLVGPIVGPIVGLILGLMVAANLALVGLSSPAHAAPPAELQGPITDPLNIVGDARVEAEAAVIQLFDETSVQMFTVFVPTFDGQESQSWCNETADLNGIGTNDLLLCVANQARQYAYSVDQDFPLDDAELQHWAQRDVEPQLVLSNWSGAVIAGADGLRDALTGTSSILIIGLLVVLVIGGAVVVIALISRSRKGGAPRAETPPAVGGMSPFDGMTTDELETMANSLLIETDDAVRTSTQELGYAVAEFGDDAAEPFQAAIDNATTRLRASFQIRQRLDDDIPEDDETKRALLEEIVSDLTDANAALDDVAEDFEALRDLAQRAPAAVAGLRPKVAEARAALPASAPRLQALVDTYAPEALEGVGDNLTEAEAVLDGVDEALSAADEAAADGDGGSAAMAVRAAEQGLAQAADLVAAIEHAEVELAAATEALADARAETHRDIAEARQWQASGHADGSLEPLVVAAQRLAERSPDGSPDPVRQLRALEAADQALDDAMVGFRDAARQEERVRAALNQTLVGARAEIDGARDFIATRRGAVGSAARTRLAEAERTYAEAVELVHANPAAALAAARRADALAENAASLARQDVSGFGGSSGMGNAVGAMILGGILAETLGGGRGRYGPYGGHGGGRRRSRSYGGSFGGGGFSRGPVRFGGSGTRRRGGGGRF